MWVTKGGSRQLIDDGTLVFWRAQGWQADLNEDSIGDETAATLLNNTTPSALSASATSGVSTQGSRADHGHSGQKLTAIASPTGGITADTQARTAIDLIRAALTAHGLTL